MRPLAPPWRSTAPALTAFGCSPARSTCIRSWKRPSPAFKDTEAAVTFTSGYATNLTVISTLVGRGDYVLSDKLNHASIVDGCLMSGAEFRRFKHNDMADLEHRLQQVPG